MPTGAATGPVNRARTYGELAAVTADLPTDTEGDPTAGRVHRHLGRYPVVAAAVLLVLLLLGTATAAAAADWDHMHAMMTSMDSMVGCM